MNKKLFKNINNFKNKTNIHNMFLMKGPYKDYTNVYKEISANKIIRKLITITTRRSQYQLKRK